MRAHAFARGKPLHDVARRIIDHTLVLDRTDEPSHEPPDDGNGGPPAR